MNKMTTDVVKKLHTGCFDLDVEERAYIIRAIATYETLQDTIKTLESNGKDAVSKSVILLLKKIGGIE